MCQIMLKYWQQGFGWIGVLFAQDLQLRSNNSQHTNGGPDPGFGLASAVLAVSSSDSPRSPQASCQGLNLPL